MTSPQPTPTRPGSAADAALYDAIATEHGTIYGYGLVSAHTTPDVNDLVAEAMAKHRANREAGITALAGRSVPAPLPAAGYQLPIDANNPADASKLALQMEEETAVAWRAVAEQATTTDDRTLAVKALTDCAVLAARWRAALGMTPAVVAFPGGAEQS
ncbi:ferritin-like domain-containing protein [Mycobacterium sp. SMC-21]|uniref:ferritin-like domain-containing protein n=1 Tax=Mycobacterium sp. SMC-21 TaxID=3381632 RepID=UPI003876696E